jgi:hypothetical protein
VGLAVVLTAATAPASRPSFADDAATLRKDLSSGGDFRVKVAAALALGKSRDKNALGPLVDALGDAHPAVRAAAAAALGSLGDPAAIPALTKARSAEKTDSVRSQLDTTIALLKTSSAKTKFLIQIGRLENKSGTNSSEVSNAFKAAARERLGSLPGIELLSDNADPSAESKKRQLPAIVLDGNLMKLAKAKDGKDVGFQAHVEFVLRKLPDQALKGSVKGDAKALADAAAVRGERELSQLQVDAVTAATESALKSAPRVIEAAATK